MLHQMEHANVTVAGLQIQLQEVNHIILLIPVGERILRQISVRAVWRYDDVVRAERQLTVHVEPK